jgi:hypothetical protein
VRLTADDLLTEIQRLYRSLRTSDHAAQSILMAQIRVYADRYTALRQPTTATTAPQVEGSS